MISIRREAIRKISSLLEENIFNTPQTVIIHGELISLLDILSRGTGIGKSICDDCPLLIPPGTTNEEAKE